MAKSFVIKGKVAWLVLFICISIPIFCCCFASNTLRFLFVNSLPFKVKNNIDSKNAHSFDALESNLFILENENKNLKEALNVIDHAYLRKSGNQFLVAQVIYRDPSCWNSSAWINVGYESNSRGNNIISKNSPVIVGRNLIGVIDYVAANYSRVRFITDSGVKVSVFNGGCNNFYSTDYMLSMTSLFHVKGVISDLEKQELCNRLKNIETKSDDSPIVGYLCGSGSPVWKKHTFMLKGFGFYVPEDKKLQSMCIKDGDLLVSSGLDGVFPRGLIVAVVSCVKPIVEGQSVLSLEAMPVVENINNINKVVVLQYQEFILPDFVDLPDGFS